MLSFIILIIFCTLLIFVITQFFSVLFRGYAPFISTKHELIKELVKIIELKPDDIVYELGAGDAPLLLELYNKFPKNHFVGLENSFLPWLIGNIQILLHHSKIQLRKKNFYKAFLGEATLLYCYLNNATMAKLESKIATECKAGTRVISLSFPFPNLKPTGEMEIMDQNVFFYTI